jgi:hypothetical protein
MDPIPKADDDPADREVIRKRFARMSDANLQMTLDAAREMMLTSTQDTWRVQVALAEAEMALRENLSAGTVDHEFPES